MCSAVHFDNNTSTKSKNGFLNCSINSISVLGHKKGIFIASLNINSILFHIDEVRTLLRDLQLHILAIIEKKLEDGIIDVLISTDCYSIKRCDRNRKGEEFLFLRSILFAMTCQNRS